MVNLQFFVIHNKQFRKRKLHKFTTQYIVYFLNLSLYVTSCLYFNILDVPDFWYVEWSWGLCAGALCFTSVHISIRAVRVDSMYSCSLSPVGWRKELDSQGKSCLCRQEI